ncbi:hypothetical protein [Pseudoruegeria sp. HB172150]|uniref:hypothetical protein n=1 Tax=Pseudoruegeria sp. HB172150 TaxID=2721164 RepID=UPI0015576B10|nr:hypothetical protein [Pseudoruegeria sp. HB172150]
MRRATTALTLAIALRPDTGAAHAFQAGSGLYTQFLEGLTVTLTYPAILLCLLPMGLLAGVWRSGGLLSVWHWFIAAQVVGIFLAPLVPPEIYLATLSLGIVTAVLAALYPQPPRTVVITLAALTGLVATCAAFEGHALLEPPIAARAGVILGANLALSVAAALPDSTLERWPYPWLRIGWRIAASWLAAITVMVFAFELSPYLNP